jgi:hypothetical protein
VAGLARDRQRARAVAVPGCGTPATWPSCVDPREQLAAHRCSPTPRCGACNCGAARASRSYFSRLSHQGFDAANAVVSVRGVPGRHAEKSERPLLTGSVGLPSARTPTSTSSTISVTARGATASVVRSARRSLSTGRQRVARRGGGGRGGRHRHQGALLRIPPDSVGQLAPLSGWSASWHHFFSGGSRPEWGPPLRPRPAFGIIGLAGNGPSSDRWGWCRRCSSWAASRSGRWGSRASCARSSRPGRGWWPPSAISACRCRTPRWDPGAGTAWWPTPPSRSSWPAWPGRGHRPLRPDRRAGLAGRTVRSDRRPGRHHRRRHVVRPGRVPHDARVRHRAGPRFGSDGSTRRGARWPARPPRPSPGRTDLRALGGGHPAGRRACRRYLRPPDLRRGRAGLGRGDAVRHRPDHPLPDRLVAGGRVGAAPAARQGDPARLGRPHVDDGLCVVGPGLSPAPTDGPAASRRRSRSSWSRRPSRSRPASGSGSPRSRTTWPAGLRLAPGRRAGSPWSPSCWVSCRRGRGARRPWGLASSGVEQTLAFLDRSGAPGRLPHALAGDPRALPVGGWSVQPGLSYALTDQELPDSTDVWTPAGPGPAELVSHAVRLAMAGGRSTSGNSWHPKGCSTSWSSTAWPFETGLADSVEAPPPRRLQQALLDQNDLQIVPRSVRRPGLQERPGHPAHGRTRRPLPATATTSWPGPQDIVGWQPVLRALVADHPAATGVVVDGHRLRRLRPGRSLLVDPGRSPRCAPARLWVGRAVPRGIRRRGDLLADAIPLCPPGRPGRGAGLGRPGRGVVLGGPPRRRRRAA